MEIDRHYNLITDTIMNIKRILASMLLMAAGGFAFAHDFVVTLDGQKVFFKITSERNYTAEVTYRGSIADKYPANFEGELVIPAAVEHKNNVYSVTGISPKAFSGADKLTGVVLPTGLTYIGDFAFEGCTSLKKIIFPGNKVHLGQGVFFKCDKIENISLGSDWKEVDLKIFRWSDSLSTIIIPAKMEKIINMKYLKHLENISVDINNSRFTSVDGVLYNKSCETLYGCPRGYRGTLKVTDSTKFITFGALIDCKGITGIDFPASLTTLSFREFSRMPLLSEIVFRSDVPLKTAIGNDVKIFLLQIKNPKVKIFVPKVAKKLYKSSIGHAEGEYKEICGDKPYFIRSDQMPTPKAVKGRNNL